MSDLKCMYCAEMGITNTDVFIEIVDVELGAGWICKECFIESEKEKEEYLKKLEQELKRKEQECEGLKEEIKKHNDDMFKNPPEKRFYCKGCTLPYISKKLKQTLTEIKPILEYYANSTIGEKQEDGTYRIELSYKYGSSDMYGAPCYYKYNPKPARQALQKISEVVNETINN